jgi:nucleoside-diphosphate-sugar epimerase
MGLTGWRVLVTGGGGFLGSHLVAALRARGATVSVPRRAQVDLRDPAATERWFALVAPDAVVHAAAVGGGIGFMRAHPAVACTDNLLLNTSVIEAARKIGVKRYIGVSSACAYPGNPPQPMREEDIETGAPEPTNGPYGYAKRVMLVQGAAYAAEYGFDCAFVVPTNLYGPGDDFDPDRSHVVSALIRRFEEARKSGAEEVVCWGTGRATRDLLHARDAAEAIAILLERGGGPAPINLGGGREYPVAELATEIAKAVGFEGRISWDTNKPDGMPRKVLDTSRAAQRLGWFPRTPLADGLLETVEWFRRSSS